MKREYLDLIINEGEGLTVEFKESYSPRIDRDIVAFSNTKGGYLLLGVTDDGNIKGIKLTNKLKAEIIDLARKCEPSIEIKKIISLGKIIIIEIEEGPEKPYSCSEGYYRRLDAVTQKMTQKEIKAIFKVSQNISFESQFNTDLKIKDISLKKIKGFLNEAKTSFKVTKSNLVSFLMSLGIYKKEKINNAGVLMFAAKIEKYIPYSEIVLVAFKGNNKTYIYDRKDIRDDLLTQLNESVEFIKKHLNIRSEIHGMDRYDIYEIPVDALREALVNAIVHRDYSMKGTSIYVEIYDDRVVIVNPGGVPSGITKSNFGKESIRRNSIIADLFHRMGKVERIGSGIIKMRTLIKSAGLKQPSFELENFFRVTFYRDSKFSLKKGISEKTGSEIKVGDKVGENLTVNQNKIIEAIKKNTHVSARELSKIIGISQRKIESNIAKLKSNNLIKHLGSPKGGYWEIIKSEKNKVFDMITFGKVVREKGVERVGIKVGDKVGDKVGERVGDKVGEKLTLNQNKIIEAIKENPHVSARELSKIVGISPRKIESNIAKLKKKNLLRRIGSPKGGSWEIVKSKEGY